MPGFMDYIKERLARLLVLKPPPPTVLPRPSGPPTIGHSIRESQKSVAEKTSKGRQVVVPRPQQLPNTLTTFESSLEVQRPRLFEPSLRHCLGAFRQGEPVFADSETAQRWNACRRIVMDEVLWHVSHLPQGSNLVLRGSVLLKCWFPECGREPGDIDWVVIPSTMSMSDDDGRELIQCLLTGLRGLTSIGTIRILVDQIQTDEIWTYERAPGKRIVIPWESENLPRGAVQMDIVFGEALPEVPETQLIRLSNGLGIWIHAASRQLSLVWKLVWLLTDSYPQGKDLYDAVLLAEEVPLKLEMLSEVLGKTENWWANKPLTIQAFKDLEPDWANFIAEFPWIRGDCCEWTERLIVALSPAFR